MATAIGKPKTGLRTYSKRVKTSSELPPNKKRRVDNPSDGGDQASAVNISSSALEEVGKSRINVASNQPKEAEEDADTELLPSSKPTPRSSIRNYFKPLVQQSNRGSSMSTLNSSDTIEAPISISPPSSPPTSSSATSTTESRKPPRRPRRRLTTRNAVSFEEDVSIKGDSVMAVGLVKKTVQEGKIGGIKKKNYKGNLQQMHIDLGQNTIVPCRKCGMIFNITNPGDKRLHDKHCNAKFLGPSEQKAKSEKECIWEKTVGGKEHRICVITANSSKDAKNIAIQVLDFTHEEMGGYQYELSELWSQIPNPKVPSTLAPRFKFYVYYIGSDIIGTILAEVYREGIQIWGDQLGTEKKVVVFDRIWVDKNHRHRGYARQLADTIRRNFDSGREITKEEVGTSELTEFGKGWAKAYFGV